MAKSYRDRIERHPRGVGPKPGPVGDVEGTEGQADELVGKTSLQ